MQSQFSLFVCLCVILIILVRFHLRKREWRGGTVHHNDLIAALLWVAELRYRYYLILPGRMVTIQNALHIKNSTNETNNEQL